MFTCCRERCQVSICLTREREPALRHCSLRDSMQGTRPSKTTLETYPVLKLGSLIHITMKLFLKQLDKVVFLEDANTYKSEPNVNN